MRNLVTSMKHLWMLWNDMRCGRCGIFLQRFKSGLAVFSSSLWQELEERLSMQQEEVQHPVEVWSLWWQEDVWKLKQIHLYIMLVCSVSSIYIFSSWDEFDSFMLNLQASKELQELRDNLSRCDASGWGVTWDDSRAANIRISEIFWLVRLVGFLGRPFLKLFAPADSCYFFGGHTTLRVDSYLLFVSSMLLVSILYIHFVWVAEPTKRRRVKLKLCLM